jgi:hypothetical protein
MKENFKTADRSWKQRCDMALPLLLKTLCITDPILMIFLVEDSMEIFMVNGAESIIFIWEISSLKTSYRDAR